MTGSQIAIRAIDQFILDTLPYFLIIVGSLIGLIIIFWLGHKLKKFIKKQKENKK